MKKLWFMESLLTASSKSPDMPIDSSHCSSDIPRALHTSLLHLANVWKKQIKSFGYLCGYAEEKFNSNGARKNMLNCYLKVLGGGSVVRHSYCHQAMEFEIGAAWGYMFDEVHTPGWFNARFSCNRWRSVTKIHSCICKLLHKRKRMTIQNQRHTPFYPLSSPLVFTWTKTFKGFLPMFPTT